jgi:hypothetical protein
MSTNNNNNLRINDFNNKCQSARASHRNSLFASFMMPPLLPNNTCNNTPHSCSLTNKSQNGSHFSLADIKHFSSNLLIADSADDEKPQNDSNENLKESLVSKQTQRNRVRRPINDSDNEYYDAISSDDVVIEEELDSKTCATTSSTSTNSFICKI